MKARYTVYFLGVAWFSTAAFGGYGAHGQNAEEWRTRFAAGEEARQAGDTATYATEMAAAADIVPEMQAGHDKIEGDLVESTG